MKYIINEMLLDLNLGRKYAIRTEFVESEEVDLVSLVTGRGVVQRGNLLSVGNGVFPCQYMDELCRIDSITAYKQG